MKVRIQQVEQNLFSAEYKSALGLWIYIEGTASQDPGKAEVLALCAVSKIGKYPCTIKEFEVPNEPV